jgi:hypothetical protein
VTPVVLSLLAAGIWFSGRRVRDRSSVISPASGGLPALRSSWLVRRTQVRAGPSPSRLGLVSGALVVVAALAIAGPVTGSVAGVIVAPLVAAGAAQLARRSRLRPDARRTSGLALTVDLLAAALRAGQPIDAALAAVAATADSRTSAELAQVAGLLRLGADPPEAWKALLADPVLGGVARPLAEVRRAGSAWPGAWNSLLATYERKRGPSRRPGRIARRSGRWRHSACASFPPSCASGLSPSSLGSRVARSPASLSKARLSYVSGCPGGSGCPGEMIWLSGRDDLGLTVVPGAISPRSRGITEKPAAPSNHCQARERRLVPRRSWLPWRWRPARWTVQVDDDQMRKVSALRIVKPRASSSRANCHIHRQAARIVKPHIVKPNIHSWRVVHSRTARPAPKPCERVGLEA